MSKRRIKIDSYDTAVDGLWTLSSWQLSEPELDESYASVPGRADGPLDLSTILTDGEPHYRARAFEAVLESSEGTRLEREARINAMINQLDGWRLNIILPDDDTRYITGRVRVKKIYNDLAHCSVQVTATCEPWRYNVELTTVAVTATSAEKTIVLSNEGRKSVIPVIDISEEVVLKYETSQEDFSWARSGGQYLFPDLYLKTGTHQIHYSGSGQIKFTYREAVL
jgi:hypothetical protein